MRWILKAISARWPAVAFGLIGARWLALFAAGHLLVTVALVAVVVVGPVSVSAAVVVVAAIFVERLLAGRFPLVASFQFAVWFWRTWPIRWAEVAGKTKDVQAVTGGENQQRAGGRPVLDAPRLFPSAITANGVRFRCGPPPGRTMTELAEVASQLAASASRIHSVGVEFETVNASRGTLFAALSDPLDSVVVGGPEW